MLDRLIAFFLFFLPFQFALNPTISTDLPVGRLVALVIISWWLILASVQQTLRIPPLFVTGSLLSFLVLAMSSITWAPAFEFAARKGLFLVNFFPLLFVFYDRILRRPALSRLWVQAFLSGAAISALLAIGIFSAQAVVPVGDLHTLLVVETLPFFLGPNLGQSVAQYSSLLVNIGGETILRATAFFPDPHVASFFFGISLFLALGLFLSEGKKRWLLACFLFLVADLLTFSRGGYLGLIVGGSLFLYFNWKVIWPMLKPSVVGVFLTGLLLSALFGQPMLARFGSSFSLSDTSSIERLSLWEKALESIAERPWGGAGLGGYVATVLPTADYRLPYYVHNLFLDIAVELGLVGLLFFLTLIGAIFAQLVKKKSGSPSPMRGALLAALALYLTHSLFETALYSVHILPLLVFVLVLSCYDGEYERPTQG